MSATATKIVRPELLAPAAGPVAPPDKLKFLVVAHVFYTDLWPELQTALDRIPVKFDLVVTSPFAETKAKLAPLPKNMQRLIFHQTPNRGRDIAPWLHALPVNDHLGYDVALKLHTKKSLERGDDLGDRWREFLWRSLLFDSDRVAFALNRFADPMFGLLMPVLPPVLSLMGPRVFRWHPDDLKQCDQLLARFGLPPVCDRIQPEFAPGSMFYYRPAALAPLLKQPPSYEEFPQEPLARVGTLAHAIEHMPWYIAKGCGFTGGRLIPEEMLKKAFITYEERLLSDDAPVNLTLREFAAAIGRSLRFRVLGR
ncbi:MAG: rhamnan synthesis F family protein [Victivallaceae bacterium]|nr:rhamnan synthesis F family protein [Victivallaceae bacterium]